MTVTEEIIQTVRHLAPDKQREVLTFAQSLQQQDDGGANDGASEESRLGQTGVALAGAVWPSEDFSDWESPGGS